MPRLRETLDLRDALPEDVAGPAEAGWLAGAVADQDRGMGRIRERAGLIQVGDAA